MRQGAEVLAARVRQRGRGRRLLRGRLKEGGRDQLLTADDDDVVGSSGGGGGSS